MGGLFSMGDPSLPAATAAMDRPSYRPQPNSGPLGQYTGAPPRTALDTRTVPPLVVGQIAACIVPPTRENRFVTIVAPNVAFAIFIGSTESVSASIGIALPAGLPYEMSLPGGQAIYAVTNAPIALNVTVQIAAALAGDLERNLR